MSGPPTRPVPPDESSSPEEWLKNETDEVLAQERRRAEGARISWGEGTNTTVNEMLRYVLSEVRSAKIVLMDDCGNDLLQYGLGDVVLGDEVVFTVPTQITVSPAE